MTGLPFFTIGHSTRSLDEFVALLAGSGVQYLADVRTVPRSRTNPQFNADTLPDALAASDITYAHVAELGGLRGKSRDTSPALNGWWENESFHNYADYALTAPFQAALAGLIALGQRQVSAVMCAEAVWWRCHRRIIADHLLARGKVVLHIMGEGALEPAGLSAGAEIRVDGTVIYPGEAKTVMETD